MLAITPIELQVLDFYVIGFRNDFHGRIEAIFFNLNQWFATITPTARSKYNAKQLAPSNF
ncbi:hypothetical protein [Helicobacter pylori]|uniref:hypothetical protein n=1 Tax=Helicobacter pylori TaxID=210 RepID=UPI003C6C3AC4